MKHIYYLLLLPILLFSSCNDNKNKMPGDWKLSAIYVNAMNIYDSPMLNLSPELSCMKEAVLTFNEDMTLSFSMCGKESSGKYSFANSQVCIVGAANLCSEIEGKDIMFTISKDMILGGVPELDDLPIDFSEMVVVFSRGDK